MTIFITSSGFASTDPCLSCIGNQRAGFSSERAELPPLTCCPGCSWLSHCWFMSSFSPIRTPSSFSAELLSVSFPVCVLQFFSCLGLSRPRGSTGHLDLLNFIRFLWVHLCPGPPGWHPVHQVCHPHHSLCQLAAGALNSHCPCP